MNIIEKLQGMLHLNSFYTFIFIFLVLVGLYFLLVKLVMSSRMNKDQKRRTQSNIRGIIFVLVTGSAVTLWADDIYQYILSLAALAAGVAIALKEFFLNIGGTFYRLFAKPFSVGDRIEIDGMRGDVVDVGLMSVLVMEVDPGNLTHNYTGRNITIPNSAFLTKFVLNENESAHHDDDFILHSFEVPIENTKDWKNHYDTMLESATISCDTYRERAFQYFKKVSDRRQLEMPKTEPRINLKFKTPHEIDMIVRVSVPVSRRGTIEQEIIRKYLEKIHLF